jgi:hypothetical protein
MLYQTESAEYLSIASKLINMVAHMTISANEVTSLRNMLISVKYWKDLGFTNNVSDEQILMRLEEIKVIKKTRNRKPSEVKRLLIELLLTFSDNQLHAYSRLLMQQCYTYIYIFIVYS